MQIVQVTNVRGHQLVGLIEVVCKKIFLPLFNYASQLKTNSYLQ